jgi:tRNA(fMet)-specific endonuclease VapC
MIYLLDTDTFIFMVRGLKIHSADNERQRQRQAMARRIFDTGRGKTVAGHEVALSAITVAEMEFGAQNSGNYEEEIELVRRAMSPFALLDFDAFSCSIRYGEIRHTLASQGTPIGNMDLLIAAHARALNATLVTDNIAEFSRVHGLTCENWAT